MKTNKLPAFDFDPRFVEYLPVGEMHKRNQSETNPEIYATFDENNWYSSVLSDLGSLALKGGIAYFTGGIYLLRYTKTFTAISIDFKNGDFSSIFKRTFKNISYGPKIKIIHKLIQNKQDDRAMNILDEILLDLESIDDFELRSSLNVLRAKLHFKSRRFLAAAIYYMEAATLTSCQKLQKMGEGKDQALVNKTGMLYLISLQSLSIYLKTRKVDENFEAWMKDLARRATTLLDKEAQYREVDKFHFTKGGEIAVGFVNLPYPALYKDEKSAGINRKLALEAEKVKCLIEKRNLVQNVSQYLNDKLYMNEDVDFLLEVAEQVASTDSVSLSDSLDFFDHVQKIMGSSADYNDCLSHIDILIIQIKMRHGKIGEKDILYLFKLLDKESANETSFLHLLSIADKLSTQLEHKVRKDFASLMLEKNYAHLTPGHIACYHKLADSKFISQEPDINCLYPSNVIQFRDYVNQLEVKERSIIYKGEVQILSHEKFKEIVVKKTKFLFPEEDLKDFAYLLNKDKKGDLLDAYNLLGLASNLISELHLEDNLKGIKERIKNEKARIGIFGLTKVGKSTFINTLIGREILKSDRGVATNIQTIIKKGLQDKVTVTFRDNNKSEISVDQLGEFTSEQGNPQNAKNVLLVEVVLNCNLPLGIELLDIPGFGVNENNFHLHGDVIDTCLGVVDGVFLVTTPNDGLKSFELDFIKKATQVKKLPFVFIANKMDELDEDETQDLKLGLKEKLEKNGIKCGSFPTFYVSSQMGLSFIDSVAYNRFFGMTKEEAQAESGLLLVKESLRQIGEEILSQKEKTIVEVLMFETENHKYDMVELMNDTDLAQKSSKDEVHKKCQQLKIQLNELDVVLTINIHKYQASLECLNSLDVKGMASRLLGRVDFKSLSNKKEDFAEAVPACKAIFEEEVGSVLKLMGEPLEICQEQLLSFSSKTSFAIAEAAKITKDTPFASITETPTEHLGYLLEKLLFTHKTVIAECERILAQLKANESWFRKQKLSEIQKQYEQIKNHLCERIQNMEDSLNYSENEFEAKKQYFMDQINNSDEYLQKLGQLMRTV